MENKNVLGIVASYRKTGNSEIVIKAIAEKMDGWELSLISLPRLDIRPCKGCYACLLPGIKCNLDDDMQWLLERIDGAGAVVFAVPDYVLGPVGIMKMVADRALQAMSFHGKFRSKRTVVALTLGREDYRGYSDTALISQVSALGLTVSGLEIFYGTHPGEAALTDEFGEKVDRLAGTLKSGKVELPVETDRCPRCLSDLFRIRGGELECALCKSLATQEGKGLRFHYFHPEFGDEGRQEHIKWLIGKKEEYASMKDKLSEEKEKYRGGLWIMP